MLSSSLRAQNTINPQPRPQSLRALVILFYFIVIIIIIFFFFFLGGGVGFLIYVIRLKTNRRVTFIIKWEWEDPDY